MEGTKEEMSMEIGIAMMVETMIAMTVTTTTATMMEREMVGIMMTIMARTTIAMMVMMMIMMTMMMRANWPESIHAPSNLVTSAAAEEAVLSRLRVLSALQEKRYKDKDKYKESKLRYLRAVCIVLVLSHMSLDHQRRNRTLSPRGRY
jgi:hypothetical protein